MSTIASMHVRIGVLDEFTKGITPIVRAAESMGRQVEGVGKSFHTLNSATGRTREALGRLVGPAGETSAALRSVGGSAQTATAKVRETASAFDGLKGKIGSVQGLLATVGLGVGVGQVAGFLVSANREFESLTAQLRVLEGSATRAQSVFAGIEKFASRTPFSIGEITEAFIKLRTSGIQPTERMLTAFGDLTSARGKNIRDFAAAVEDAVTGEFERLKEFGIKAKQSGDLVALTFNGQTTILRNTAGAITEYLQKVGEAEGIQGSMAGQMTTLNGVISNLWDNVGTLARTIGEEGLNKSLKGALGNVSSFTATINANRDAIRHWTGVALDAGEALGKAFAVGVAVRGLYTLGAAVTAVSATITAAGGFTAAISAVAAATGPGALVIAGLAGLAAVFYIIERNATSAARAMEDSLRRVETAIPTMGAAQLTAQQDRTVAAMRTLNPQLQAKFQSVQRLSGSGTALEAQVREEYRTMKERYDRLAALAKSGKERLDSLNMIEGITVVGKAPGLPGKPKNLTAELGRVAEQVREIQALQRFGLVSMEDAPEGIRATLQRALQADEAVRDLTSSLTKLGKMAPAGAQTLLSAYESRAKAANEEVSKLAKGLEALGKKPIKVDLVLSGGLIDPAAQPITAMPQMESAAFMEEFERSAEGTRRALSNLAEEAVRARKSFRDLFPNLLREAAQRIPQLADFGHGYQTASRAGASGAQSAGVGVAFVLAAEALKGLTTTLAPAFEALLLPVNLLGQTLGKALLPVFQATFPIFKAVAIAGTVLGQVLFRVAEGVAKALGGLIIGIGHLIKLLPGDSGLGEKIKEFGRGISNLGDGFGTGADEMARLRDELKGMSFDDALKRVNDGVSKLGEALTNVPPIFDAMRRRMDAIRGGTPAPTPTTGGNGITPGSGPRVDPGAPPVNFTVNVYNPAPGMDARSFAEDVERVLSDALKYKPAIRLAVQRAAA
jgi:hypothetical protein